MKLYNYWIAYKVAWICTDLLAEKEMETEGHELCLGSAVRGPQTSCLHWTCGTAEVYVCMIKGLRRVAII